MVKIKDGGTPVVEIPKVEEKSKPVVDAMSLTVFIWALYKLNIITRIQVRDFLEIIRKGGWPEDFVGYLASEVKKI